MDTVVCPPTLKTPFVVIDLNFCGLWRNIILHAAGLRI